MKKILLLIAPLLTLFSLTAHSQNALNFDGSNDYVQTSYDGVLGSTDRTFEAWIYIPGSAPSATFCILDYGQNLSGSRNTFLVGGDRSLRFISGGTFGNIISGPSQVPENEWVHVAFVLNAGTGYLYVNGSEVFTGSLSGVDTPSGTDLRIGQRVPGGSIYFNGNIDEVRIWNVARTEDEIIADMNNEYCDLPENLVAYYQFNEGIAGGVNTGLTTLPDLTPSANDGTLNSFSLSGPSSNWVNANPDLEAGSVSSSQTLIECAGTTITIGGSSYSETGVYTDVLTSVSGCDSIVTTDLTIMEEISGTQTLIECAGSTITVGESEYSETGVYIDILTAVSGCDSTVTTDLTIMDEIIEDQTLVECAGTVIIVGESEYSETGVYTDILTAVSGCDSTVITDLTIMDEITGSQTLVECAGTTITVGDSEYSETGVYTDILTAVSGCDSTVITNLTIMDEITGSQTLTECAGTTITVGDSEYWETGVYTDVLTTVDGCDSTVTTDLTILPEVNVSVIMDGITLTANEGGATYQWIDCDSAFEPIDGATEQSYTAESNGNYAVIVTVDGCSDTSECQSITSVNIIENGNINITLYPNPTQDELTISTQALNPNTDFIILDINGRIVLSGKMTNTTEIINVSNLEPGVYLIKLQGDSIANLKFIKN